MDKIRKITIASDSFKESISSKEVAKIINDNILKLDSSIDVKSFVIADGGEGTVDTMLELDNFKAVVKEVQGPRINTKVLATYCYNEKDNIAIIEMAAASGLELLREDEKDPAFTNTYGTGELIIDAAKKGAIKLSLVLVVVLQMTVG